MIDHVRRFVLPAAYSLLPSQMKSDPASAMLLAIGLQESRFEHRRQVNGPARGFWQFEKHGGVKGVLAHPSTAVLVRKALRSLQYPPVWHDVHGCYDLIVDNDTAAAAFARLLLWTVPGRLPSEHEAEYAWQVYIEGWRPGKPHRNTWNAFYREAWMLVNGDRE